MTNITPRRLSDQFEEWKQTPNGNRHQSKIHKDEMIRYCKRMLARSDWVRADRRSLNQNLTTTTKSIIASRQRFVNAF